MCLRLSFQRAVPKSANEVGVCRPNNSLYDSKGIKGSPPSSVRLQDINPPSSSLTLSLSRTPIRATRSSSTTCTSLASTPPSSSSPTPAYSPTPNPLRTASPFARSTTTASRLAASPQLSAVSTWTLLKCMIITYLSPIDCGQDLVDVLIDVQAQVDVCAAGFTGCECQNFQHLVEALQ